MHKTFLYLISISALVLATQQTTAAALPDFTDLIKNNSSAVVKINTLSGGTDSERTYDPESVPPFFREFFDQYPQQRRQAASIGSGFLISSDGYLVTNHHVIDGASEIMVRLNDRREYEAEVIGSDSSSDLALLKIEETDLQSVTFADPEQLEVGDWVLAIGSPFDLDYSASAGIVSAIGRSLPNGERQDYVPFIQTDVAINPGNSGGPLFNLDGEVVGINSQIFTRSGGFMGLSFAIPTLVALDVIEQLKNAGQVSRGWLGVGIQDINRDLALTFGLDKPQGALIASVSKGSPAEEAGFQQGDVILEFNDQAIEFSHDLPHVVGLISAGTEVKAQIIRNKEKMELSVVVGELDQTGQTRRAGRDENSRQNSLGLRVSELEQELAEQLEVKGGVVVNQVLSGSAAEKAGLRRGDVIVQLDFADVHDPDSFAAVLGNLDQGEVVPVLFYRNGIAAFRTIRVDD